eukprot:5870642-Pleurochrysis_carterae.AAC.3
MSTLVAMCLRLLISRFGPQSKAAELVSVPVIRGVYYTTLESAQARRSLALRAWPLALESEGAGKWRIHLRAAHCVLDPFLQRSRLATLRRRLLSKARPKNRTFGSSQGKHAPRRV